MKFKISLPFWTIAAPVFAMLALVGIAFGLSGFFLVVVAVALIAGVLAAVHHAEVVAHRVGEPFGTLVVALAITIIEVACNCIIDDRHHADAWDRYKIHCIAGTFIVHGNAVTGNRQNKYSTWYRVAGDNGSLSVHYDRSIGVPTSA